MDGQDVRAVSSLYGGFWSFDFTDHCYMTNPYFPPDDFMDALGARLKELVKAYPSTNRHISSMVASPLGLSPDELVVANGASELIAAVTRCFVEHLAVPVPTFDEYVNRARSEGRRVSEYATSGDFELDVDDFIRFVRDSHANAALLVRPANPTGTLVPKVALEHALRSLRDLDLVIVDESFIDFVDGYPEESAMDLLSDYSNLLILRSLSKNYGIPGLRLGYAASGNRGIVARLRDQLPIWNINSLAQFFLEELAAHERQFLASCQEVRHATRSLYDGLERLPYVHPYPTQGNFILCRVLHGPTATELTARLFDEHRILVNDRSGKGGLDDRFFRLASRTVEENAALLGALEAIGATIPAPEPAGGRGGRA